MSTREIKVDSSLSIMLERKFPGPLTGRTTRDAHELSTRRTGAGSQT
jgi:hypothetical protein